jgi:hypothetical protein
MGCYLKLANYHSPFGQASSVIHDRVIRGTTKESVWPGALQNVSTTPTTPPPTTTAPTPTTPTPTPTTPPATLGSPITVPATFEAENFDKGGQGIGYRDLTTGNAGNVYRTTDDVDLAALATGGYVVNNFQTGEWLGYTLNVPSTANYDISIRAANNYTGSGSFHIEVDGVNVSGPISVPLTGGWATFQWFGKNGIPMSAGTRKLRIVSDAQYFNVDQVRVAASSIAYTPPANQAPTVAITSPANGQTVSGTISCGANAADDKGVSQVQFYVDSTLIASDAGAPYGCTLDTARFANGTHVLKAVATDAAGLTATSQVSLNIQNAVATPSTPSTPSAPSAPSTSGGTPYSGTPIALPATFEAENFDKGGQGVGYRDLTTGNTGNLYRTAEDVDLAALSSGGYIVNNFQGGEWLGYTVNVPASGNFDIAIRASNNYTGAGSFHVEVDGVNVSGPVSVAQTGAWSSYQWFGKNGIALAAGTRQLRIVADTPYFNVDQVRVLNSTTSTATPTPTTPAPVNQGPTVSFRAPANGQTLSGAVNGTGCEALALDDKGVGQVQFYLGTTLLNADTASPFNCAIDTTRFANGSHVLKALATDAEGASGTAQVSVNIQNAVATPSSPTSPTSSYAGTPYSGTAIALPGTIEVENFDKGGQGVAFNDLSAGNAGGQYRTAEAVDIVASNDAAGGGFVVNNFQTGEWMAYTVNIATAGSYDIAIRASNNFGAPGAFHVELDGTNITGSVPVPVTGAWNTYQWVTKTGVTLPAGRHVLKLVSDKQYFNVNQLRVSANGTSTATPTPTSPTPPIATTLPSTGTRAVATFESLGLYWAPGTNPGAAGCQVQYRKVGESAWKQGLALWYDSRNSECRGSLVHLTPGSDYQVQFGLPGQAFSREVIARTWSESLPVAKTVYVTSGSQTLNITEGGSANGYVLYTAAPGSSVTLDAANAQTHNVSVNASYVIVRGLTLKGAVQDAVRISPNVTDVVIEDNDISNWGRTRGGNLGVDLDSGVRAVCSNPTLERVVIQRNKIHHPRYGANSWSTGHPAGPQGITFENCGGNHVMRYNDIWSSAGKYFNDVIGGADNFTNVGFPHSDSDIYGNRLSHGWDDGIEAEGGNKNVRIWGNYIDSTAIGIATTTTATGPVYVFRNVQNRAKTMEAASPDSDSREVFAKSGSHSSLGGGRRYLLHNTLLQATQSGASYGLGAGYAIGGTGSTQLVSNTISRNNIFHTWKPTGNSTYQIGSGNEFSYNLVNGNPSSLEGSLLRGTPTYASGNGWQSEGNGMYQLAPSSLGYDKGVRIPNFNDAFTGAAPDVGAHEAGTSAMRLGVSGGAAH